MNCKFDTNQVIAKGLCRKHYDALPERIAKRVEYMENFYSQGKRVGRVKPPIGVIRAKHNEYMKAWRIQNPERARELNKEYRLKHPDQILARRKKYYEENRERILLAQKAWREANREEYNARKRAKYHKLKGGDLNDSKTSTRGNSRPINKEIQQGFTGNSSGGKGQTVSPQEQ